MDNTYWCKGTHTFHFNSSLFIINQKPMIHRTDFHCITTWVHALLGEIWQCICFFLGFKFTGQMAQLFQINFYFHNKIRLCLRVEHRGQPCLVPTLDLSSTRQEQYGLSLGVKACTTTRRATNIRFK